MSESKRIYFFGSGDADAGSELKHLVGGKGASLGDMTRAGLNVPPGFTISAECCELYYQANRRWPVGLEEGVRVHLARLEKLAGRRFGGGDNPLLVAVRSGAAQSMPGMMDTVLNVGLNPDCVGAMAERTGNPRGAWEAYRHFLALFGHTVGGVEEAVFSTLIAKMLQETACQSEVELDAAHMEALCRRLLAAYRHHTGRDLPTDPWDMLCQAIDAVFDSWNNERAIAYRKHHHIDGLPGTAVNVQMMCPAEVSGVMFTANPINPALNEVLIESSFGLGEAIVLGKVTPDRFVLDKDSLRMRERVISVKDKIVATLAQDGRGQTGRSDSASLTDTQIEELARLGLRVESYFKAPCDIEWALSQGEFYLLQARAIKGGAVPSHGVPSVGLGGVECEEVRQEEIAVLRAKARPEGTVWSRYNLSEILPAPTPMTWAIVRRFMSGKGGFGLMYRDLGFDPDPALDEDGIFDLVCGRPYCNLSREPRMHYRSLPFEHSFAALKANPHKALYPQAVLNPARGGWRFWLFLPVMFWKLARSGGRLRKMSRTFAERFQKEIVPPFVRETTEANHQDLSQLDTSGLLQRLEQWIQRTLFDFARESLKPTALAAIALGNLERALAPRFASASGLQRAQAVLRELVMCVRPDPDTNLPGAVRGLAAGQLDRAVFLRRFGHRGSQEMELSQPRWVEDPAAVDAMTRQPRPQDQGADAPRSPASWQETWERIAAEAKLTPFQRAGLEVEVQTLLSYLTLRESAKHYLMQGYAVIRQTLVELDRRFQLDGGIFFLTPEELQDLPRQPSGETSAVIEQRRRRRELALSLPVPQVLFSDDLEAIGRPVEHAGAEILQGVPLSAGVAEGPALVLLEPTLVERPAEPYVLVCPSTDPAWVPLFVQARALVMETGGVLSHGAIVAREFGLPAVAGLPDVHRRLRTGQRIRVDGATGRVNVVD